MSPKTTKEKKRYKALAEMTPEERAAYDKLGATQKAVYDANLAAQAAQDALEKAKADAETAREKAKRDRAIASGERKLAAAVRNGEVKLEDARALIRAFGLSETGATLYKTDALNKPPASLNVTEEETEEIFKRVEEASKKAAPAAHTATPKIVAPSFKLSYSFGLIGRAGFVPPADGAKPDATLSYLIRRYGFISPFLARQTDKGLEIMDGRRRYHLIGETESVPTVIVSGFPDEYTAEAAEMAINRGRSLNAIRAGEVITRSRTRGKSDPDIRRDMGFKTGEVDKYAKALTLPEPLPGLLRGGLMTAATALTLAKASVSVREAVIRGYNERKAKETQDAPARISEADVDAAKQEAAKAAINRDAPTLTGLTGGVSGADVGAGEAAPQVRQAPPAHPSPVSGVGNDLSDNTLDNGGASADTPPAWLDTAFERLGEILAAIPQDAPANVLERFRQLRAQMLEIAGETEYVATPDDQPAVTFKAPKKAEVENTTEARPGWKASVLSRVKPFLDTISKDAEETLAAANAFKAAVSASH